MNINRIILWIMIVVGVAYDVLAVAFGWPSISQGMRDIDTESGTLFRWLIVAVWLHCFMPSPWGGWAHN